MLRVGAARLAALIGGSESQIGLFEAGASRVGADRLLKIAAVLDVEVTYFFSGAEALAPVSADPALALDALELNRAFILVADRAARRQIIDLAVALGSQSQSKTSSDESRI